MTRRAQKRGRREEEEAGGWGRREGGWGEWRDEEGAVVAQRSWEGGGGCSVTAGVAQRSCANTCYLLKTLRKELQINAQLTSSSAVAPVPTLVLR